MSNRLGNSSPNLTPAPVDKTNLLVIDVMRKQPKVTFEFLPDGNIRFKLPLAGTVLAHCNIADAKLLQTRWFADAVGEFLVRVNLNQLDEVVQRADYADLAQKHFHTGFGLRFCSTHLLFQFHCELLHRIFNEGMRRELRGVEA